MYLETLGIFGWNQQDENLLLASLLTGDPLLLIGNHGCAKTHLGNKIAQALQKKYLVYDASKAMFEDVLDYPNVLKLGQGEVEYVPSPVTIWDKELILIDEISRTQPELQSKWLEIIRSRKVMGFETQVKWVWAAMNPSSYACAFVSSYCLLLGWISLNAGNSISNWGKTWVCARQLASRPVGSSAKQICGSHKSAS